MKFNILTILALNILLTNFSYGHTASEMPIHATLSGGVKSSLETSMTAVAAAADGGGSAATPGGGSSTAVAAVAGGDEEDAARNQRFRRYNRLRKWSETDDNEASSAAPGDGSSAAVAAAIAGASEVAHEREVKRRYKRLKRLEDIEPEPTHPPATVAEGGGGGGSASSSEGGGGGGGSASSAAETAAKRSEASEKRGKSHRSRILIAATEDGDDDANEESSSNDGDAVPAAVAASTVAAGGTGVSSKPVKLYSSHLKLLGLIQGGNTNRKDLRKKMGIGQKSLTGYLSDLRRANRLTDIEDKKLYDDFAWKNIVKKMILEKKSLEEILEYCDFGEDSEKNNKSRLNKIITKLYESKDLNSKQIFYLKSKKVIIGRRGDTKEKILNFLEKRSKGSPTKTLEKLATEFNNSSFKLDRSIVRSTFTVHVKEMLDRKSKYYGRMKLLESFYNSCKVTAQSS